MGLVCLQGGAEMAPPCAAMDDYLLELSPSRDVVLLPLAGAPGAEYDGAVARGIAHFAALGATVRGAPDARHDEAGAIAAIEEAGLLFLPGGSPARVRDALVGTPVGRAVIAAYDRGALVAGASAGAMVLCGVLLLPDRKLVAAEGLGLVPELLVLPHYDPTRSQWRDAGLRAAGESIGVLGLPESSGVLIEGETLEAVGVAASVLVGPAGDETLALGV